MNDKKLEVATLGGGCFWCLDAIYRDVQGVERVVSGYSGGHVANPSYEQVCGKRTGHAEVVQVWYDPAVIAYEDILYIFWRIHDPTTPNRQGNDVGPQYRSVIFYHDEAQRAATEKTRAETEAGRVWPDPVVTEIVPFDVFYEAEEYHQDYFARNPYQPYCVYVVDPKVRKFRKSFQEKLKQAA
jgi:peptide-methionine (S)-S-oxide reductase